MIITLSFFLAKLCIQLDPNTVWLKQEFGRRCYFPDANGQFNFDKEVGNTIYGLSVEGAPAHQVTQTVTSATPSTSSGFASQPFFKPFGTKKGNSFNVKVIKANMKKLAGGKLEFEKLEQTHVSLEESNANVVTVSSAVQGKWGVEYMVVTGDGLEVDDSAGTQGTQFSLKQ